MAEYGDEAVFLAAGGYHHHLGANIWESAGAPQAPPGTARLRSATILLADAAERDAVLARAGAEGPYVTDPSGNRLLLEVAGA
jgi:catechol 2,3-dioxygenase